jgi:hypothetical protein
LTLLSAWTVPAPPTTALAAGPAITLLPAPHTVLDTSYGEMLTPETRQCVTLAGLYGIPQDAEGVMLNVTAYSFTDVGAVAVSPAGVEALSNPICPGLRHVERASRDANHAHCDPCDGYTHFRRWRVDH